MKPISLQITCSSPMVRIIGTCMCVLLLTVVPLAVDLKVSAIAPHIGHQDRPPRLL